MKSPLSLSLAALAIMACTDSNSPTSALAPSDAKSPPAPEFTVSGTLTNQMYTFDDGTFSGQCASPHTDVLAANSKATCNGNGDGWTCGRLQPLGNGFEGLAFRDNNVRN